MDTVVGDFDKGSPALLAGGATIHGYCSRGL